MQHTCRGREDLEQRRFHRALLGLSMGTKRKHAANVPGSGGTLSTSGNTAFPASLSVGVQNILRSRLWFVNASVLCGISNVPRAQGNLAFPTLKGCLLSLSLALPLQKRALNNEHVYRICGTWSTWGCHLKRSSSYSEKWNKRQAYSWIPRDRDRLLQPV